MNFIKGTLYVSVLNGNQEYLFYPDEEVPQDYNIFHLENIAKMRWGAAEPSFGGAVECSQHGERTGAGHLVEFKKASDEDILAFLDKWSKDTPSTIAEWLDNVVKHCKELSSKEKRRIAHLAKNYI